MTIKDNEDLMIPNKQVRWILLHKWSQNTQDHEIVARLDDKHRSFEVTRPGDCPASDLAQTLVETIHERAQEWTDKGILIEQGEAEGIMDFQKRKLTPPTPVFTFHSAVNEYKFDAELKKGWHTEAFTSDDFKLFGESFARNWKPIVFKKKEVAALIV